MTLPPSTSSFKRRSKILQRTCNTLKNRFPILKWLPTYNLTTFIQDLIAGVTVGLTAIPQGIAYAVVAGLSPEYGLYAGLLGGFIYLFVGSCKDVTVGPTAVMSTLVAKYVSGYSADFAVLAAFLTGIVALLMGIFRLGFLLEFISQPVTNGFTTAAALQIAASQLRALFGQTGPSGNYFAESIVNFVKNVKTTKLWDPILGFSTIVVLILLKRLGKGCGRTDPTSKRIKWFVSLARNAIVVFLGIIIAYLIKLAINSEPLTLTGEIKSGLPPVQLPPFSTIVGNETYTFTDMLQVLGPESVVLPLVGILELVAIAKAFAAGAQVDATQEMIAVGLCNILGSFVSSMPVTGSFTRTALNHVSGVQTTAGGIATCLLVLLALSFLTSTFYFIPKATLAGLIITAMFSMIEYEVFVRLWRSNKREFVVIVTTVAVCLFVGLEYGIISGIVIDSAILLFLSSRPPLDVKIERNLKSDIIILKLSDTVPYCAADHIRRIILKASNEIERNSIIVIDGTSLKRLDSTVAVNLMSVVKDLEKNHVTVLFLNFNSRLKNICLLINPQIISSFVSETNDLY